jgi:hypothetical protein
MAVTAAPARKEPGYVDVEQAKLWAGFGRHGNKFFCCKQNSIFV